MALWHSGAKSRMNEVLIKDVDKIINDDGR